MLLHVRVLDSLGGWLVVLKRLDHLPFDGLLLYHSQLLLERICHVPRVLALQDLPIHLLC